MFLRMSLINAGEVSYFLARHHSEDLAREWKQLSWTLPVSLEVPGAADIWGAADIKARFPIAYADAFAAQLAIKYGSALVTGDPEFQMVTGLQVEWLERS